MARILIVDDSKVSRKILKTTLEEIKHEVVGEAVNGIEAVEKFKELQPDIVTMDVTMPELDGISALKQIMELDAKAKVVMVTAAGQKTKMITALKAGASEFITKPIEKEQLITAIHGVLNQ